MDKPQWWPWEWWPMKHPRAESQEVIQARERLAAITRDDVRVASLEMRTQRILRENNLAPLIMRALGIRR